MLCRRLSSFILLGFFTTASLWAGTITFEPESATSQDDLSVVFHENDWFVACDPALRRVEVRGDRIVLAAVPPTACTLNITHNPYTLAARVGTLPAGTYTVVVETVDGLYEPLTQTAELTVTEAGAPVPEPPSSSLGCVPGPRPAATLLLPYFEIDLEDPTGRNTLMSVHNVSDAPVVTHVVVWTNWAIPVLSFDLAITGEGVRSIDLRHLLVDGELPRSELPVASQGLFPGCDSPLEVPQLTSTAHTSLLDRLAGRPDPPIICYASKVEDGTIATGFVTVDVVNDCSGAELLDPLSEGYFAEDDQGLATDDNVLWGDFFLVDTSERFAQGLEMVSVVADAKLFGAETETFYHRPESHRAPLGQTYRTRYFRGGAFDGGTDVLVWNGSFVGTATNCDPLVGDLHLSGTFRNEAGQQSSTLALFHKEAVMRLSIGEEPWPVESAFGTVDFSTGVLPGIVEPFPAARQGWVAPIYSAAGRYSVGLNAVQLEGFCPEP